MHVSSRTGQADADTPPSRVGWDVSTLDSIRPVAQARRRAVAWVRDRWGLVGLDDVVELVVGELCTNAVRHGGGLAGLELQRVRASDYCPAGLRVLVTDFRPDREPHVVTRETPDEHGHGMALVVAFSLRWGWHRLGVNQKQVWCKLALPAPAPGS